MGTVRNITFGVLTVSDRCYGKQAEDKSGNELKRILEEDNILPDVKVVWTGIVPDNVSLIQGSVEHCCDVIMVNVLLITGGTGLAPRDVTPDALRVCIEREVPGMSFLILQEGLLKTPYAALSRSMVGVRGKTLIASLPGSLKGSVESFKAIVPVIPHAVDLIVDVKDSVAITHEEKKSDELVVKSKVVVKTDEAGRIRESPYPMIKMTELPDLFKSLVSSLEICTMRTEDAVGHVLGESVVSGEDIPQVRTSMKDGFAVGSCQNQSIYDSRLGYNQAAGFNIIGEYFPGGKVAITDSAKTAEDLVLSSNEAVKVSTGSPIPAGTACVVQVEDTKLDGMNRPMMKNPPAAKNADIREIGSDICVGQVVVERDTLITETELGVLAAIGRRDIPVIRKPVVAVLSSGDELQDPWGPLKPAGVRDSNKLVLKSFLRSGQFRVIDLGIVQDEPDSVLKALTAGFDSADVVISTGGMSMGQRDIIKDVLIKDLGVKIHFGRLAMKPGKPTGFGTRFDGKRTKYWFGLPGNPASAFVTAHLVVLPVLKMLCGWTTNVFHQQITAIAGHDIKCTDGDRVEYQRGIVSYTGDNGEVLKIPSVVTTGETKQRSSSIYGCSRATCLVEIPAGKSFEKGEEVMVTLLK